MRKAMTLAVAGLLLGLVSAGPVAEPRGWKLVWGDEFETAGAVDPGKWRYEVGFVRNHEKQYYTRDRRENVRVENGHLVIEGRREEFAGEKGEKASYTAGSLDSTEAWTYGRIEVRAKLPKGRGAWPAIWTLGTNIKDVGWPACGEIDVMEEVGFEPGRIHASVHTKAYNHVQKTQRTASVWVDDAEEAFHVYALEWSAEKIQVSVDGVKYFTFTNEGKGNDAWPFDKPQYLKLNLAIGGDWGGQKGIDDAAFPMRYEVDYVRVYRKE